MEKRLLKEVIMDQQRLTLPDFVIPREIEMKMGPHLANDLVVILSGLRRCGKSTLLHYLRKQQKQNNYFLNFDDERLVTFKLSDFQVLYELFIELFGEQDHFYFDEIQNIPEWERFIRRLHDYGKKVFITGSNAGMLSAELGTRLTGRYQQIELLPFSFREFLQFRKIDNLDFDSTVGKGTIKRHFNEFVRLGGIPAYVHYQDSQYLSDLYEGILYRDIVARYSITKIGELKELSFHAASNVSKAISYNKLRQAVSLRHATTVKDYFYYLQQSYLLFLVSKFDVSTKRQMLAPKKLYFVDTALAQTVGFRASPDIGRLLENVVYLELRRRSFKVYYFHETKECDFIAQPLKGDFMAIQVTTELHNPSTMKREIEGLVAAMEHLGIQQGFILTADEEKELSIQTHTIQVLPIWKWLLQGIKQSVKNA